MAPVNASPCAVCESHAEAVFHVEGLDCNDEVVLLERSLRPIVGVESLSADVVSQRLRVSYDAARVSTGLLVTAVAETGLRMRLEHEQPTVDTTQDRRHAWLLATAAVAIAASAVAGYAGWRVTAATLSLVAIAGGIGEPARRALAALRARTLDINTLMVLAVAGAVALGEWLEGASVVFLFAVSRWLETRALTRARLSIRALLDLAPRDAVVRRHGRETREPVDALVVGDIVIVRPGDKVPVDGTVVAGETQINEAALTGESLPMWRATGADVFAGTVNGSGSIDIRVTRVGPDTRMAHITHLVEEAQSRRAPIQTFVDRFGRWYTPVVAVAAVVVAVLPPLAGGDPATWLYRGLVFLVVACPCALVVSTPVAIVAALASAARHGVLVKGGAFLERLAAVDAVALDKTGTLTRGQPVVLRVEPTGGYTSDDVLGVAAAVESRSGHPLARAIVHAARHRGLVWPSVDAFVATAGRGAAGTVAGASVIVGNREFVRAHGVTVPPQPQAQATVVYVAIGATLAGWIELVDEQRHHAPEAIEALRALGVDRLVLLTGDRPSVAGPLAAAIGVEQWHAGLSPEDKRARVEAMRADGRVVAMVGDGINDAPALAVADVGVAMGAVGSDAAIEAADVALMSDELLKLPYVVRLARATVRTIRLNVAISLVLKGAFLVAAVTGTATLWMAVVADTGATVVVVANALRLLRQR